MDPSAIVIIVLVLIVLVLLAVLVMRKRYQGTGEICIRAGVWECSVCGELIPMSRGNPFPPCEDKSVVWVYRGTKKQIPGTEGGGK